MEEFLLLGQIPGTHIVITFWMWLLAFLLIGGSVAARLGYVHRKQLRMTAEQVKQTLRKRYTTKLVDEISL